MARSAGGYADRDSALKIALAILGLLLVSAGGILTYETRNTVWTFEEVPLRAVLPIVSGAHVEKSFTPGLTEKYEVRLHFQKETTPLNISTFISEMQKVDVAWRIENVASGESAGHPKNWFGAGADQGWIIGEFQAENGKAYVFKATVKSGPADLNLANPQIEVAVSTSGLTDYAYAEDFRRLFRKSGKMIAVAGALLLVLAGALALRRP